MARKLSTVYERQTSSLTGRPPGRGPSWRPGSAPAGHSIEEGVEGGEATHEQLMEEGVVDSAAVQERPAPPAAAAAAGLPGGERGAEGGEAGAAGAAPPAAGAAGAAGTVPAPSLMHDIVADWGVGMRDLGAVMRASVAVYQVRQCRASLVDPCPRVGNAYKATASLLSRPPSPAQQSPDTHRIRSTLPRRMTTRQPPSPSGQCPSPHRSPAPAGTGVRGSTRVQDCMHCLLNQPAWRCRRLQASPC